MTNAFFLTTIAAFTGKYCMIMIQNGREEDDVDEDNDHDDNDDDTK